MRNNGLFREISGLLPRHSLGELIKTLISFFSKLFETGA
jgi:hypothetical protein